MLAPSGSPTLRHVKPRTKVNTQTETGTKCDVTTGERRRSKRFGVQGSAEFRWTDESGLIREGSGTTKNVSRHGVYIVTEQVPPADAELTVWVTLVSPFSNSIQVSLQGQGSVQRVELLGEGVYGFAVDAFLHRGSRT